MRNPYQCPITGVKIDKSSCKHNSPSEDTFTYRVKTIGEVTLTRVSWIILEENSFPQKHIIAGLCRNHFEKFKVGFKVLSNFINEGYKSQEFPKTFEEKWHHLLEFIFVNGGNESKKFNFNSINDYTITYSHNPEEFVQILDYLKITGFLWFNSMLSPETDNVLFSEVKLTFEGMEQAKLSLPIDPMVRLTREGFDLGDKSTNQRVNHAIKLFHYGSNIENMRSACETLSFVLEPLRSELKEKFSGDTEEFFNIVNNFNIRHNKDRTKRIEHMAQLEWVFYGLLNTIRTYYKIK